MNILSLYANAERLQVAFAEQSDHINILKTYDLPLEMGELLPNFDDIFAEIFSIKPALDIIACSKGPGTFTTLRVLLSTVQGLALGRQAKIFASTTFDILAQSYQGILEQHPTWILVDSRSDFYYAQYFKTPQKKEPPCQIFKKNISEIIKNTDYILYDTNLPALSEYPVSCAEILCFMDHVPLVSFKELRPFYMHLPAYKKIGC